ncbi:MAG: sodium:calcium antiporter, partial [Calditrichaeota bacterium]
MPLELIGWSVLFVISLAVLLKSAHHFTLSAEHIGLMFGAPPFVIGLTIISMGTSLPELLSSLVAVMEGAPEIVGGNVIGSNIANIFLILGVGAILVEHLRIKHQLLNVDLPLLLGSVLFLAITAWDGFFSVGEALLAVLSFVVFLIYTLSGDAGKSSFREVEIPARVSFSYRPFVILVISGVFLVLGAKYTIEAVIRISALTGIGREIVAVTAVAVGTSLPELAVTWAAARKGNAEFVVGNVIGSNIFNTFAVMGIPGLIGGIPLPPALVETSLPILIIATVMVFVTTQDREMTRWEGWLFLVFYALFVGKVFGWV